MRIILPSCHWVAVALAAAAILVAASCSRDAQAVGLTPAELQQRYGITDAYAWQVTTTDGALRGTRVPSRFRTVVRPRSSPRPRRRASFSVLPRR